MYNKENFMLDLKSNINTKENILITTSKTLLSEAIKYLIFKSNLPVEQKNRLGDIKKQTPK